LAGLGVEGTGQIQHFDAAAQGRSSRAIIDWAIFAGVLDREDDKVRPPL